MISRKGPRGDNDLGNECVFEGEIASIAIFLPSLNGGGAERAMLILANAIAARGIPVDLILASAEGPYLSEISNQVRIIDLQAKRVSLSILKLIRYFRQERPEVMLSALNYANVIALVAR